MKGKSSDIIKVGNIYIYKLIFSQDGSPKIISHARFSSFFWSRYENTRAYDPFRFRCNQMGLAGEKDEKNER